MILYYAGSEPKPYREVLKKAGIKNILYSFYSIGGKEVSGFEGILLDSGGFAARTRNVVIDVKKYAEYINKHNIDLAFNLDTNDLDETLANQKYLEENTHAYIIPIYHFSDWKHKDSIGLLNDFIKEYPYIGIGGVAGQNAKRDKLSPFLNYVFYRTRDKVAVHGLGMTSKWMVGAYPFYSIDSTSWLSMARYASSHVHSKSMSRVRAKSQHHILNSYHELPYWIEFEHNATKLWANRGIVWKDNNIKEYLNKKEEAKK